MDLANARPVAIMLNNLKKALPQLGVSQADLIYELPAEGGITRMMAVFQSVEGVGDLGSVRSARDYYVSLARGHDAVFLHAGGSPQAYSAIKNMGVTALDEHGGHRPGLRQRPLRGHAVLAGQDPEKADGPGALCPHLRPDHSGAAAHLWQAAGA